MKKFFLAVILSIGTFSIFYAGVIFVPGKFQWFLNFELIAKIGLSIAIGFGLIYKPKMSRASHMSMHDQD